MLIKMELHPAYRHLANWIQRLPDTFGTEGEILVDGRNQVREVVVEGERLVVKYFKRITTANRFVYRYFRASKASRAYRNAQVLLSRGVSTPFPVASFDVYSQGKLVHSFFVSRHVAYPSAYELMARPYHEVEEELKDLAAFLFRLHRLGIFHADLNLSNVLYRPVQGGAEYCLIDNNRIRFRSYTRRRAMRNLRRLQMPLVNYAALVDEYARLANQDVFETFGLMMFYRSLNRDLRKLKRFFKELNLFKVLTQKY